MTPAPTAKRPLILAGGQITCSLSDAGRAIGAYAFATTPLKPGQMPAAVGPGPTAVERARWSAEIYDFQRPTPGPLTYNDLIANIALSSQIKEYAFSGMLAVMGEVNVELNAIPVGTTFWNLPNADHKAALRRTDLWRMWRAVELFDAVPGVAFTIAHKTLHHKRPELFPLLDNVTEQVLPYGASWTLIHKDLTTQSEAFAALEEWFAVEAKNRKRPSLTRLRMHDIIVWLTQRDRARAAAGKPLTDGWADAVAEGARLGF